MGGRLACNVIKLITTVVVFLRRSVLARVCALEMENRVIFYLVSAEMRVSGHLRT